MFWLYILFCRTGLTYPLEIDPVAQIREGKFQIVVTTSLAEEGLDLPEPQWVFHMDPSSPVQALREIRGRAPLNGSRFVAICRNNEQTKKIDDLLKREENMKRSSKLIISNLWVICQFQMNLSVQSTNLILSGVQMLKSRSKYRWVNVSWLFTKPD